MTGITLYSPTSNPLQGLIPQPSDEDTEVLPKVMWIHSNAGHSSLAHVAVRQNNQLLAMATCSGGAKPVLKRAEHLLPWELAGQGELACHSPGGQSLTRRAQKCPKEEVEMLVPNPGLPRHPEMSVGGDAQMVRS